MFKFIRRTFSIVSTLIIAVLLSLNIAMVASVGIYDATLSTFQKLFSATGITNSFTTRKSYSAMREDNRNMKKKIRKDKVLVTKAHELHKSNIKLTSDNDILNQKVNTQSENIRKNKSLTRNVAKRMYTRVTYNAARNIASVPVEAIPIVGTTVIVAVTALEIKDSCDTMHDIKKLESQFEIQPNDSSDDSDICGISTRELWGMINNSSKKHCEELRKNYDIPEADDCIPVLPPKPIPTEDPKFEPPKPLPQKPPL